MTVEEWGEIEYQRMLEQQAVTVACELVCVRVCVRVCVLAFLSLFFRLCVFVCVTNHTQTNTEREGETARPRLHPRLLTLCPAPTDPVPRGLLTLWARAGMCVCIYVCMFTHMCVYNIYIYA